MSASAVRPATVAPVGRRLSWAIVLPLAWVALVAFLAVTADWLPLPDPAAQELILRRKPPSTTYLL